jgi:pimeloyl-ACP methyl ester carboxylesterase
VVAGVGYGAQPGDRARFRDEALASARLFATDIAAAAARYAAGPTRVQLRDKRPHEWAAFAAALAGHDQVGAALTLAGVQAGRPSLYDLRDRLSSITVPVLVVTGDEDDGCLEANLMLKRVIPTAAWSVFPRTGHTVNVEEPDRFTTVVAEFQRQVEAGGWPGRNAASLGRGIIGMTDAP